MDTQAPSCPLRVLPSSTAAPSPAGGPCLCDVGHCGQSALKGAVEPWHFVNGPLVAVRITEEAETAPWVLLNLRRLYAVLPQERMRLLSVVDVELGPLERPGWRVDVSDGECDGARRACWCQLDEAVAGVNVDILLDRESELVDVERFGAVDVGDGNGDHLKAELHGDLLRGVTGTSGGPSSPRPSLADSRCKRLPQGDRIDRMNGPIAASVRLYRVTCTSPARTSVPAFSSVAAREEAGQPESLPGRDLLALDRRPHRTL